MSDDRESCNRCGAYLLKSLVQFHICKGTDTTKRPANVPLEAWLAVWPLQERYDVSWGEQKVTVKEKVMTPDELMAHYEKMQEALGAAADTETLRDVLDHHDRIFSRNVLIAGVAFLITLVIAALTISVMK